MRIGLPLAFAMMAAAALAQDLPPDVAAVRSFLMDKEYPEVFGTTHYKSKIENVVTADLDGDGRNEVIFHYTPHYRQSAPIVIYRIAPDMTVTRVKEGLAPGPLVPLSGEYLDSHEVGDAADADIDAQQRDPAARRKFVEATLNDSGSIVEYVNFFHMDFRKGAGFYIDMTGLETPPATRTCENFEFSKVEQISAGHVEGLGSGNVLAAWTGHVVYLYRVNAFLPSGLLDKSVWKVPVAADFRGFAPGAGGPLRYVTASGQTLPFAVTCKDPAHCEQQS